MNLKPPPDELVTPLLELRDYCVRQLEEYERLYRQAQQQLDHVEALLSNWICVDHNQTPKLTSANDIPHAQTSSLMSISVPDDISDVDLTLEPTESKLDNVELNNSVSTQNQQTQRANTSVVEISSSSEVLEISMLPQYENLSRIDAVKKLLQEYVGTVCHIDFLLRSLYGELEPKLFKIVKGRVQSTLTQGKENGYWSAVPEEPGCYTLDLGLVANNGFGAAKRTKSKKKKYEVPPQAKIVPMLEAYEGQFLIDALTAFLEQNSGKAFTVAEVTNGIYGQLSTEDLREVKNKVLNELSRGHRTGRFSRVRGQIGVYTWDDKLIAE